MTIKYVDIKNIRIARENPRRTRTPSQIATLANSIAEVGLIHCLAGYEQGGTFHITAGGTRVKAIKKLMANNKVKKSFYTRIPVEVRDKAQAVDVALTSNMVQTTMTLAEQFRAFNALHNQDVSVEQIAERYYTDAAMVRRILALANLHAPIFAAFEAEKIDLDTAKTYAGASQARQVAVWEQLGENASSWSVRNALKENTFNASDKFVKFIGGVKAYEARGGVVELDLFSENTVLCNGNIVEALYAESVSAFENSLTDKGWANVIYCDDYWERDKLTKTLTRVNPTFKPDAALRKRYDKDVKARTKLEDIAGERELTKREDTCYQALTASIDHIHQLAMHVPEKVMNVGTVIWKLGHDGEPELSYYKPKAKAAIAPKTLHPYPSKWVEAVNRTAGQALMDHLVSTPNKLALTMALSLLDRVTNKPVMSGGSWDANMKYTYPTYSDDDRTFNWNDKYGDFKDVIVELSDCSDASLYVYAARMMRRRFDISSAGYDVETRSTNHQIYDLLAKATDFNLADYWLLGEDELKALTKAQLIRIMGDDLGFDVSAYAKSKKTELVKVLARYVQKTRWTPDFVRTHDVLSRTDAGKTVSETQTEDTPKAQAS